MSGRVVPGRSSFWALQARGSLLPAGLLALLVVLTRLPLRTRYALNWDADQFILGISRFDVIHHQPHPPGYLAYIGLGRLLAPLARDPNTTLVGLSIAAEALAVVVLFAFARALFGEQAGWVSGLALASSPLFWYYGEAANTYALEPLLVLASAWLAWKVWSQGRHALAAGAALGLAGAFRPSTAFLLLPMLGLALWRRRSLRAALEAGLSLVAATLAWLLPVVLLSGGPMAYLDASLRLGADVTADTAIWRAGLAGLRLTSAAVARGLGWELGPFAILAVFGLLVAPRLMSCPPLPAGLAPFCWAWVLPGLATFLLIHIGQVVYVQVFAPVLFLLLGPAVSNAARALGRPGLGPALAASAAVGNLLFFLFPGQYSLAYDLARHDRQVEAVIRTVSASDPKTTVLITDAIGAGSYRTAQVYLPEYPRVALGQDRRARLGEVYGGVYEPAGFDAAGPLVFPPDADTFIWLDRSIVDRYVADPEHLQVTSLGDGARIYTWRGAPPRIQTGRIWLGPPYRERRGVDD